MIRHRKRTIVALACAGALLLVQGAAQAHGSTVGEGLKLAGPNPFRGQTAFSFRINHDMRNVELSIFDVKGRRVATLVHGDLAAGDHHVAYSAQGLAPGSYIVHLKTEHGVYSKHLAVLPTF